MLVPVISGTDIIDRRGGTQLMHIRGERSPKFVGPNIAKSDIFGSKRTEIMTMIFFGGGA